MIIYWDEVRKICKNNFVLKSLLSLDGTWTLYGEETSKPKKITEILACPSSLKSIVCMVEKDLFVFCPDKNSNLPNSLHRMLWKLEANLES